MPSAPVHNEARFASIRSKIATAQGNAAARARRAAEGDGMEAAAKADTRLSRLVTADKNSRDAAICWPDQIRGIDDADEMLGIMRETLTKALKRPAKSVVAPVAPAPAKPKTRYHYETRPRGWEQKVRVRTKHPKEAA